MLLLVDARRARSIPRLRGNRRQGQAAVNWFGSIPALTGKPGALAGAPDPQKVYPRAYGETLGRPISIGKYRGLSPRLRGNPFDAMLLIQKLRSIPALTGKPRGAPGSGRPLGVYPRAYGETGWPKSPPPRAPGLSPRLRGNPRSWSRGASLRRSIPALTGKP